jgi:hypothetical protein
MRRTTIGIFAMTMLVASGCGSSQTFANHPRPPLPINLTVYVNDARVSVSPRAFGAGPVNFIIANGASRAESVQVQASGSSSTLADTGPISTQATGQVRVDLPPGDYTVLTGSRGATVARQAAGSSIQAARLHVGPERRAAASDLLGP